MTGQPTAPKPTPTTDQVLSAMKSLADQFARNLTEHLDTITQDAEAELTPEHYNRLASLLDRAYEQVILSL